MKRKAAERKEDREREVFIESGIKMFDRGIEKSCAELNGPIWERRERRNNLGIG